MGAASNEATVIVGGSAGCSSPPPAPVTPAADVVGATVALNWNVPPGTVTSYVIEAGSAPGGSDVVVVDTGSAHTSLTATAAAGTSFVEDQGAQCLRHQPSVGRIDDRGALSVTGAFVLEAIGQCMGCGTGPQQRPAIGARDEVNAAGKADASPINQ